MGKKPGAPFGKSRPNVLIIMVDEFRNPTVYDGEELDRWRKENLQALSLLKSRGAEFTRHYAGATACIPSRATIFTGQYPSLHGVSQTIGAAKEAFEDDTYWLDPNTVPTLGHYFEEAGYRTFYKGKWHFSYADLLIPGTQSSLASYHSNTGVPDPSLE